MKTKSELKEEFLKAWPVEKIQSLTLEQYTNLEKNSFCYWLESKMEDLGSMWGGSSYKFGIYKRNNTESIESRPGYLQNENYGWLKKYGNTENQAFDRVKSLILEIIDSAIKDDLEKIDTIDLGEVFKWKVAFHYGNYNIINIFLKKALLYCAESLDFKGNQKSKISELHRYLIGKKPQEETFFTYVDKLWNSYSSQNNTVMENNISIHSLNTILYGPPGTGKTFNTVNLAIQLIDPEYYQKFQYDRPKLQERFQQLLISDWGSTSGQIAFCTFHQSFSYEDFIEGIKPILSNASQATGQLNYNIEDGIFKRLCNRASSTEITHEKPKADDFSIEETDYSQTQFYKISLGNTYDADDNAIYQYCIENNCIALGWGGFIDFTGKNESEVKALIKNDSQQDFAGQAINIFKNYLKIGNYVFVSFGNYKIRAIGKVTGEYEYNTNTGLDYNHFRKVQWLLKDIDIPVESFYGKVLSQQSIYKLNKEWIKKEFFVKQKTKKEITPIVEKKYILIIDEINRGNISQIFGELITLIEDDKRAGKTESLETILPYSKKKFTVPSNLYILGTMNTADRSVEALDTALRRRFSFVEMVSNPEKLGYEYLLENLWNKYASLEWKDEKWKLAEEKFSSLFGMKKMVSEEIYQKTEDMEAEEWYDRIRNGEIVKFSEGIDLESLLKTLNKRIEKLLNKDHQIGHAYFMNVFSIADLKFVMFNKVIPLLQEYFYGDYAKIGLVLGKAFVSKSETENVNANSFFADFIDEQKDDFFQKQSWILKKDTDFKTDELFLQAVKSIY